MVLNSKMQLYLKTGGQLATLLPKPRRSILESIFNRIDQAWKCELANRRKMRQRMALQATDISNLEQANLNLSYQNAILKSKESTYMALISEAKENDRHFWEKFQGAQEFLESQTLRDMMEVLERKQTELAISKS